MTKLFMDDVTLDQEYSSIEHLDALVSSCETYGPSSATVAYAQRMGFLSGTALSMCSVESLSGEDLQASVEGLVGSLVSKIKGFFVKCMEKIGNITQRISDVISNFVEYFKKEDSTSEKNFRQNAKTKSYKWAAMAVGIIATAAVVIGIISGAIDVKALLNGGKDAVGAVLTKIKDAIKWLKGPSDAVYDVDIANGKIKFQIDRNAIMDGAKDSAAKAGGWTAGKAKTLAVAFGKNSMKFIGALKEFSKRIMTYSKAAVSGALARQSTNMVQDVNNKKAVKFGQTLHKVGTKLATGASNAVMKSAGSATDRANGLVKVSRMQDFGWTHYKAVLSIVALVASICTFILTYVMSKIVYIMKKIFAKNETVE